MTFPRLVRAAGLVVLAAMAFPFAAESGLAEEPAAIRQPRPVAPGFVAELQAESHVVVQRPGGPAGDLQRDFVVLARPDGRVPRAWLWDEPLGCPQAPSRSASSESERSRGQSASP